MTPGAVLCRFHRYHPTLPDEGDDVVGLEAHADTSAVTILYQDGSKCLYAWIL